jgi:rhamnosyltransferase
VRKDEVKISVVIPVKNGASWLDACIQGIMSQTLFYKTEIIAIDSGSTDDSLAVLNKYPVRIYQIAPAEFNHGLTRNYGVELSRGEYVVMTVQDARPADDQWLEKLLKGFSVAENVAGVCGSQIVPHDRDKNPVDWFRPVSTPTINIYRYNTPEDFWALTP